MAKARTNRAKEKTQGIGQIIAHAPAPLASPIPLQRDTARRRPTGWSKQLANYAKALAIRYSLQGTRQRDAVYEATIAAMLRPPKHRYAEINRIIRKHIGDYLKVPADTLTDDPSKLQAITHYAAANNQADIGNGYSVIAQETTPYASPDDRRFAEENGVCPRCNAVIDLDENDKCKCGLRF